MLPQSKKWALITPIQKDYWESLSKPRRERLVRDQLVTSAIDNPQVAGVLDESFSYEVFEPAELDGVKLPIVVGGREFDPDEWAVVRAEILAIPAWGADA